MGLGGGQSETTAKREGGNPAQKTMPHCFLRPSVHVAPPHQGSVQVRRCHCRGSELLIPQGSPQEVLEGLGEGRVGGLDGEADGGGLQVGLRGFSGLDTNPPGVSNKRGKEVGLTPSPQEREKKRRKAF